jgi:OOP family OmpA-OmpF porin
MFKKILLATAMMALMGGASAEMTSFRIGAAVGSARLDFDCSGATSCDKSDTSYKIYGDYRLNDMWSVEAGYMKLSQLKATLGADDLKIKATAPYLALAARSNIMQDLDGVVRLGLARVRTESSVLVSGVTAEQAQIKVKPYLGLGLEYSIMPNLQAVVGADFTQGEADDMTTGTIRFLSVGVQYGF